MSAKDSRRGFRSQYSIGTPRKRIDYAYDDRGRRTLKSVYTWNASGGAFNAAPAAKVGFLYHDWNLLLEVDLSGSPTTLRSYYWGLDLSGTLQGAGGVGGLLAADLAGITAYYASDANGNVTDLAYVYGGFLGHYDYDAFGNSYPQDLNWNIVGQNPFRFSTKYTESDAASAGNDTGLMYYGFRFYSPSTGRWPNRDPLGENGGVNLYWMAENDPVNWVDLLGLKKCYKWMLITFYSGQKPKGGRNSWNKSDLTENDAAAGLGGYTYDPDKNDGSGGATKTGPNRGRDDYPYPPGTQVTIGRGTKGSDNRTIRDGGSGWVYPRPGAPSGVGQDEWLDLWTPSDAQARKKGTEVDLVTFDTGMNKCEDCPKGWSEDPDVPMPDNLKKIKEAMGK